MIAEPYRWQAGVDYLTMTVSGRIGIDAVLKDVVRIVRSENRDVGGREKRYIQGFRGYLINGIFSGFRDTDSRTMVQASGSIAQRLVEVLWELEDYGNAEIRHRYNVSRLDAQITIWFTDYEAGLAREVRDASVAVRSEGRKGSVQTIQYVDGCGRGDTVYLGSKKVIVS